MNTTSKMSSRFTSLLAFIFSYTVALIATYCVFYLTAGHVITPQKMNLVRDFLIGVAWFPVGLSAFIPMDKEKVFYVGYPIYLLIVTLGIVTQRRYYLYGFIVLLVANIGGCMLVVKEFKW